MTLYECGKHPGNFARGSLEGGIVEECPKCRRSATTAVAVAALRTTLKALRLLWDYRMNPAKLRPEVIQGAIEQAEAALLCADRDGWKSVVPLGASGEERSK